jgi:prevent-host-death family protein
MATWQVQQAKSRLSELIEAAKTSGPQLITKHGSETAVVISISEYKALAALRPDFKEFLLGGPKLDNEVVEEMLEDIRQKDTGRNLDYLFEDDDEEITQ